MNPTQILLTAAVTIAVVICLSRFRSQLFERLMVILLGLACLVLVMVPDLSHEVARQFGVGRGVDFLFYLAHAGTILVTLLLYLKMRDQSRLTAELAQAIAIYHARQSSQSQSSQSQSSQSQSSQGR